MIKRKVKGQNAGLASILIVYLLYWVTFRHSIQRMIATSNETISWGRKIQVRTCETHGGIPSSLYLPAEPTLSSLLMLSPMLGLAWLQCGLNFWTSVFTDGGHASLLEYILLCIPSLPQHSGGNKTYKHFKVLLQQWMLTLTKPHSDKKKITHICVGGRET